jgi:hypothetical protein
MECGSGSVYQWSSEAACARPGVKLGRQFSLAPFRAELFPQEQRGKKNILIPFQVAKWVALKSKPLPVRWFECPQSAPRSLTHPHSSSPSTLPACSLIVSRCHHADTPHVSAVSLLLTALVRVGCHHSQGQQHILGQKLPPAPPHIKRLVFAPWGSCRRWHSADAPSPSPCVSVDITNTHEILLSPKWNFWLQRVYGSKPNQGESLSEDVIPQCTAELLSKLQDCSLKVSLWKSVLNFVT